MRQILFAFLIPCSLCAQQFVLTADSAQHANITGFQNGVYRLEFVRDSLSRWIVGMEVLQNPKYGPIVPQLLELDTIIYIKPKDPIEE
jgi:hypothetical protein